MPRLKPDRLLGLLAVAVGAATAAHVAHAQTAPAAQASMLSPASNRALVEQAATILETRYVFPELRARYASALRDHAARGDYDAITDAPKLAERVTADLHAVSPDGHLRLYAPRPAASRPAQPTPGTVKPAEQDIAPGIRAMKWVAPGVAYIAFGHFDDRPEGVMALNRFLTDYASAKALVIDSRENHGGAFDMLGILANALFPTERKLADMDMASAIVEKFGAPFPIDGRTLRRTAGPDGLVRFEHWSVPAAAIPGWSRTPVYYLTSHTTYSAAEHMAMVLKSTGRATLIGETTGGGNHFGGTEPVGDGFELFVPIGHTTDPATGRDWERTGVAPDVAVPAAAALDEALRRIANK